MRLSAFLLCAASLAAQQPQQPIIRSRVTIVPLDVRVVDEDGRPITDLTAADFKVTEDGVTQEIAHFAAQGLEPQPAAATAPMELASARHADAPLTQTRRVFLIALTRGRHQAFKHGDALVQFLRASLMPQDVVAMTAWNRATDFTTDHARMSEVAARYADRHEGIEGLINEWYQGIRKFPNRTKIPAHIQKEIDWVFEPAAAAVSVPVAGGHPGFADVLRRSVPVDKISDYSRLLVGLNYLRFFAGEKRLVWFSEFAEWLPRPITGRGIAAMASANRIAIDTIQTGGTIGAQRAALAGPVWQRRISLPVIPASETVAGFIWRLQTMRDTAAATGGLGSTLESGAEAFAALAALTSFSYSLGYYPADASLDGKFREIRVTVTRPRARVLARSGYYANASAEPLDLREYTTAQRVWQAVGGQDAGHEIGVTVTNVTKRPGNEVAAAVRLDLSGIAATEENGVRLASLELAAIATGDGRAIVGEVRQRLDLKLLPGNWDNMVKEGMKLTVQVPLKGRARDLKVIAYHYASDSLGSTSVRMEGR